MRFVDTNIFVRYLTRDDPAKGAAALALFRRVQAGEEEVTTCESVVAEITYVLSSRRLYNLPHGEIHALLLPVLTLPSFQLPDKEVYLRALELYAAYPLDFEDVMIVARMESRELTELYSYDRDFDRIEGITRREP